MVSLPVRLQPAIHSSCLELPISPWIQSFGECLSVHGGPTIQGKSLVEVSPILLEIAHKKGQSLVS